MAIDKVTSAALETSTNQPVFRNLLINSDMSIAQRSTSISSISSGNSNYPVDRFRVNLGTAGTWTLSQDTTNPRGEGFSKSIKMDCTTANGSLSAGSYMILQQLIEGQNLTYLNKGRSTAKSLTVSFWVRSNKTGTYICELYDSDNTRHIAKSYTISSADTWEKKTITYDGDTSGGLSEDNGESLRLNFWLVAGTTYSSGTLATSWSSNTNANRAVGQVNLADSTSNEWYVTGIQLEAGDVASDFEFLPVDVNLQRCQRYYQFIGGVSTGFPIFQGYAPSGSNIRVPISFKVNMRSSPTVTKEGSWLVQDSAQPSFDFINNQGFSMKIQPSSSTVAYSYPNSADDIVTMDSEL